MTISIDQQIRKAKSFERKGDLSQAFSVYHALCQKFPKNARAQKGYARVRSTQIDKCKPILQSISQAYAQDQYAVALAQCEQALLAFPQLESLWTLQGAAAFSLAYYATAEMSFRQILKLNSNQPEAHANLAATQKAMGNLVEAVESYANALRLSPDHAGYLQSRGAILMSLGELDAARNDLLQSNQIAPEDTITLHNLGLVYHKMGQFHTAQEHLMTAVGLTPDNPDLLVDLASIYEDQNEYGRAIRTLETAVGLQPGHFAAEVNLGSAYLHVGNHQRALEHLNSAVDHNPANAQAYNNLSVVQFTMQMFEEARQSCLLAIEHDPTHASAYQNLGNVEQQLGHLRPAVEAYEKAVALDANLHAAQAQKLHFQAQMCDWAAFDEFDSSAKVLGIKGKAVAPWCLLGFEDHPERQRLRSARYAAQWNARGPVERSNPKHRAQDRIRLCYVSSDIYDHATLFLLNGVLAHHDKSKFEVFVYCLNAPQRSAALEKLMLHVAHFRDVHAASDEEIVALAQRDSIDIAVDLKGYTKDARPGLFFAGLAPIQVNFLGYPGTMASECIDYIIADKTVLPPHLRPHYAEKIIYMPHSYQPNDNQREIASTPTSRATHGLPEDAVVLCCFNQSYKISPVEFDIWMRIMGKFPNTVLWLLDCNQWAKDNLRNGAKAQGVSPERLIFAPKLAQKDHLARHRCADLFVDTFNVNAHTTASDALWAGLPVITKPGLQFAARVSASLLNAVGMQELIAANEAQYEQLIVKLLANPSELAKATDRLRANLNYTPLFDTENYTKNLETGLKQVWTQWQHGRSPQDVHVLADRRLD
ncbi:MAG: tetratricopeptide repeat protein [Sulfitobacter sp.]